MTSEDKDLVVSDGRCFPCQILRRQCIGSPTSCCEGCEADNYTCDRVGRLNVLVQSMFPSGFRLSQSALQTYRDNGNMAVASGAFGQVYRVSVAEGRVVAVKVPHWAPNMPSRVMVRTMREALIWSGLEHPNIHHLMGVVADVSDANPRLCLVSPWMENGDAVQYLRGKGRDSNRLSLLLGIARGVEYLHRQTPPIVHGDLKGNNILISEEGQPMLTDFGLSHTRQELQESSGLSSTFFTAVNPRWVAPERVDPDSFGLTHATVYTPASDVFSMLRTFLEIITGKAPYHGVRNEFVVLKRVMMGVDPPRPGSPEDPTTLPVPDILWRLMSHVWQQPPRFRMTAEEVVYYARRLEPLAQTGPLVEKDARDALSFLDEIKARAGPLTYNLFLDVLLDFKEQMIDSLAVVDEAVKLLSATPELLRAFNEFLPEDLQVTYKRDALDPDNIVVTIFKGAEVQVITIKTNDTPSMLYKRRAPVTEDRADPADIDRLIQRPVSDDPPQKLALTLPDALAYLDEVKAGLGAAEYDSFLDILHDFNAVEIDYSTFINEVAKLFFATPELLLRLNEFLLPANWQLTYERDTLDPNCTVVTVSECNSDVRVLTVSPPGTPHVLYKRKAPIIENSVDLAHAEDELMRLQMEHEPRSPITTD